MESNNIYVTKKEFYSTISGIFTFVFLTLFVNRPENKELRYVLLFFIGAMVFYNSYKSIKERTKVAGTRR